MAADLPITPELKALLSDQEVQAWLVGNTEGGFAPAWREGKVVMRFDREEEAERFRAHFADRLVSRNRSR
jgi:hypothetical protein